MTPFLRLLLLIATFPATLLSAASPGAFPASAKAEAIGGHFQKLTEWLNGRISVSPGGLTEERMQKVLHDPHFASALAQHRFISKTGVQHLTSFAMASEDQQQFLSWLLGHTEALERFLEGATPIGKNNREADRWTIDPAALRIWCRIFTADPESRSGLYLRLAMATGLNPPGTGNQGAGQAATPDSPLSRFQHFKSAHRAGALFPSFDTLSVWELRQIVSSNASNADLAWGRDAINTWRPDLRINELVVNSTSEVWRRNSPIPFENSFRNVLAGGGKCGPRSSWAIFICQAFGIPAVGVRQPGHVCATYKSAYPDVQPQPGQAWKVVYGRGWHVSKACGLPGEEFMTEMALRGDEKKFFHLERHRWLSAALSSPERVAAIKSLANRVSTPGSGGIPLQKRAEKSPVTPGNAAPENPPRVPEGVIHIEAEDFAKAAGIAIHECFLGGKQLYNAKYAPGWGAAPRISYKIDIPAGGTYQLTLHAAVANLEQFVHVTLDGGARYSLPVPNSHGLWSDTPPLELRLPSGTQTLTLTRPAAQRGLALRYLQLRRTP